MDIAIRELAENDLAHIPAWAQAIQAERFTSRLYPRQFLEDNLKLPNRDSGHGS